MNKLQAMVQAMMLLNEDGRLVPGTREYMIARRVVAGKIDRLGPQAAVEQIRGNLAHLLAQIKMAGS